jgi:arabinose-5-phosphate isomerase
MGEPGQDTSSSLQADEALLEDDGLREDDILTGAREVFQIEADSVLAVAERLDERFVEAARRMLAVPGRIVVSGVGKSGLVARKVASTLASTGTPAMFLHPVEGAHGDVGVLLRGDLLLAVSRSGNTDELAALLPAVQRLDIPVIVLTGDPDSPLALQAEVVLDVSVREEACPHDLSPTASSAAAMAMGDALAMTLVRLRNLQAEDLARLHPGGLIGRRLLWRVDDVMVRGEEVPMLPPDAGLDEAMHAIAHRRGTVPIVDDQGRVVGVITAGDLTRFAGEHADFLSHAVPEAMNPSPKTVPSGTLATEALTLMEAHGIMAVPVVGESGRLLGIVHLHDVLRARVR